MIKRPPIGTDFAVCRPGMTGAVVVIVGLHATRGQQFMDRSMDRPRRRPCVRPIAAPESGDSETIDRPRST